MHNAPVITQVGPVPTIVGMILKLGQNLHTMRNVQPMRWSYNNKPKPHTPTHFISIEPASVNTCKTLVTSTQQYNIDIYHKNTLPSLNLKSWLKVIHAYYTSFTQHKDLNIEFGISTFAMFTVRLIPVPGRECHCVIVQRIIAWIYYSSNRLDAVFLAIFFCHNSSKLIKI